MLSLQKQSKKMDKILQALQEIKDRQTARSVQKLGTGTGSAQRSGGKSLNHAQHGRDRESRHRPSGRDRGTLHKPRASQKKARFRSPSSHIQNLNSTVDSIFNVSSFQDNDR